MTVDALEITRCPAELCAEALALVLCELAPSQRKELADRQGKATNSSSPSRLAEEALFIARRDGEIRGAAWGQRQSGNVADFWPPQLVPGEPAATAMLLAEAVVAALDKSNVDLAQALLPAPCPEIDPVLRQVGFRQPVNLLYLSCEAARFPIVAPEPCEIDFEAYSLTQRERLMAIVERTYENTLDCPELDGVRSVGDVLTGYQATGEFRPENWLFVRHDHHDIGVLLLADHVQAGHWELVYMGLAPEFRRRGWGRQIARYAQWLARAARVSRILVAVDAVNEPAVKMYRATGFEIWECRAVYLRFPPLRRG